MEAINTFSEGMNSDVSKTVHSKDSYLQAINFRPLTELGESNGGLVNVKGNECKITYPDIQPIYKLIMIDGTDEVTNSKTLTITLNGITGPSLTVNNDTTGLELYTYIVNNFTACYQNTTVTTKTFAVAYGDNYIVFYQQPIYSTCSPVDSVSLEITLNYGVAPIDDDPLSSLQFIGKNGVNSITQDIANPYVDGVEVGLGPGDGITSIGSTFILDDIFILTAPSTALPDNDSLTSQGAIWKLNIDDITKVHTLTLLYSSNLDFTKYHPIPPSAITGRYESKDIKRIYWSDNYNKIRTINTAGSNLMALNPSIISVMPKTQFTQGILDSIISGSLDAGCYQMGYRLSKVLGSITNYSELSNPVYLVPSPEASLFQDYESGTGATGKGIVWKLDDLDPAYDQIEIIIAYRSSATAVPTLIGLPLTDLTPSMTITLTDISAEGNSTITLEEFLLFNGTFTHAKTCDTKDNRLFWGNVSAPKKGLGNFDARSFRANDAGNIRLKNNGTTTSYTTVALAAALAETEDTINEYYNPSTGDYSVDACYLKPSTALTTKVLGGEGLNISYEFGTFAYNADIDAAIVTTDDWDLYNSHVGSPYRFTDNASGNINLNYSYPQNNKFNALKQPERTSILKGFQHEEIYRFGFQAFDLAGNPYFTKWIGDIKMPSYGDTNSNPGYPGINDFRMLIYGPSNNLFTQTMYVKFTIDVSSIADQISGYEIVRVKREGTNKTIWGMGMVNPMVSLNGSDAGATAMIPAGFRSANANFTVPGPSVIVRRYYRPNPDQNSVETLNIDTDDGTNPNFGQFKTFDCFDFDLGLRPTFSSSDRLLIRSQLTSINYRNSAGGYRQFFSKEKDHSGNEIPGTTTSIDDGSTPPFILQSNNDSTIQPFFIMKMVDDSLYCDYTDFVTPATNQHNYTLTHAEYILGNDTTTYGGYDINNLGLDDPASPPSATDSPSGGKQTLFTVIGANVSGSATGLYTNNAPYNCTANSIPFKKLIALYYKPNANLYGGFTYANRSNNTYIPCGEYISIIKDDKLIPSHIKNYSLPTLGGDTFSAVWDMQKTFQKFSAGAEYWTYNYSESSPYAFLGLVKAEAKFSTTFFYGITSIINEELRSGYHMNRDLTGSTGYEEDSYLCESYCNAENDIKTYFPKPLNFQTSDEWINRVYFSELKFNNEPIDSWSIYLTNNFYDVEGNYGPINALISLKDNMYYLQERGVGLLMINPVSMVNDAMGQPIKLGAGSEVIQKHYYKSIDSGTSHQWSVYRSQSAITFIDVRHKKLYMFNGEQVIPISDLKGQRNFIIKRLHKELLTNDNPVINKGILTTYDYYHNEFLYTFNNKSTSPDTGSDENYTLAYSEITGDFSSLYNFTPTLYINSNKYLLSTTTASKLWFHNYGAYGNFYGVLYPSYLKFMVNDNPQYTKVFDNLVFMTEVINDNIEWSDDLNVYPGAITVPAYPDDVNHKDKTFTSIRAYNDSQNTDWVTLDPTPVTGNIRRVERSFNLQLPRNKFNYDTTANSTFSIFDSSKLTKTTFGERLRDKWLNIDLSYPNTAGLRFVVQMAKTLFRISDR